MLKYVVGQVLVLLAFCGAVTSFAQTGSASSRAQARGTQYAITLSQGTANLQPQGPFFGSVPTAKGRFF